MVPKDKGQPETSKDAIPVTLTVLLGWVDARSVEVASPIASEDALADDELLAMFVTPTGTLLAVGGISVMTGSGSSAKSSPSISAELVSLIVFANLKVPSSVLLSTITWENPDGRLDRMQFQLKVNASFR
jgi:hypothetical protein